MKLTSLKKKKRLENVPLPFLPREDTARSWYSATQKRFLLEPNHAGTFIWDFKPQEMRNFCCLQVARSGILSQQPGWTKMLCYSHSDGHNLMWSYYIKSVILFQVLSHKAYSDAFIGNGICHSLKLSNSFFGSNFYLLWCFFWRGAYCLTVLIYLI